jgi:hypothetical protein
LESVMITLYRSSNLKNINWAEGQHLVVPE